MPNATEIKRGNVIKLDDDLWKVLDTTHYTPGNKRGFVQVVMRNLKSGAKHQRRLRSTDSVEKAYIEKVEYQYLYRNGDLHVFMNNETYEQSSLEEELVGDSLPYLREGDTVSLEVCEGEPVGVDLPSHVVLTVAETGPGTRGDTVSNVFKDATLETGHVVKVPLYVENGEKVKVDTRTGEFVERV